MRVDLTEDMAVAVLLLKMYRTGVYIDPVQLSDLKTVVGGRLAKYEEMWRDITKPYGEYAIGSPQQCTALFYGKKLWPERAGGLKAPVTDTGNFSAGKEGVRWALTHCGEGSDGHTAAQIRQVWSRHNKLLTAYIVAIEHQCAEHADGRLRCTISQSGTVSGRFSCQNPNLQSVPRDSSDIPNIRECFMATPGYKVICGDFSQFEIAIMAHMSGDVELTALVQSGKSMHDLTAERTGVPRAVAKVRNLAMNCGAGPKRIAVASNIPLVRRVIRGKEVFTAPDEIIEWCRKYKELFVGMEEYKQSVSAFGRKHGYVETLFGQRRYIPDLTSDDKYKRFRAERIAGNLPIQGTAADIGKKGMIALDKLWRSRGSGARLLLQVHDEYLAEAPENEAERCRDEMKRVMESVVTLSVPIRAEVGIGSSWSEAK